MNKIAQQFQNDVAVRYQQKMAGLLKVATPVENQAAMIDSTDTGGAPLPEVPETTMWENLANSAPVSGMLDAIDSVGNAISHPIDTLGDLGGSLGTGLGELVNSFDPTLKNTTADGYASDGNVLSSIGNFTNNIRDNLGDWIGDLRKGSEGELLSTLNQISDNNAINALQNKMIQNYRAAKEENPLADVHFRPDVNGVLINRSPRLMRDRAKNLAQQALLMGGGLL